MKEKNNIFIENLFLWKCKFDDNIHMWTSLFYLVFILTSSSTLRIRRKVVLFICHSSPSHFNNTLSLRPLFAVTQSNTLSHPVGTLFHSLRHKFFVQVMSLQPRHWAHIVTMSTQGSLQPGGKKMPELKAISNSKHAEGHIKEKGEVDTLQVPSNTKTPPAPLVPETGVRSPSRGEFCTTQSRFG